MTIGELRKSLFNIDNQEMTIRELRSLLFKATDQEEILSENSLAELEIKQRIFSKK